MNPRRFTLPSGLVLAADEAGPADAPTVVFVHGIAQSKKVFHRVLAGPLARELHMIAFDLRGHGDSQTPEGELSRAQLADDLAAVIAELDHPWIAPWSFGGVVVGEYLRAHGDAALGGLIYLAGAVRTGREAAVLHGATMMKHARSLLSEDAAVYATAAREFVTDSTVKPLPDDVISASVADMLRVVARVRRPLLAGGEDYTKELAATTIPVATIHGAHDTVVLPAMSDLLGTLRPVKSVRIRDVGHLPWLEAPEAFDAALRSIVLARAT
jgi:non-heme chloroperoxidase